MSEIGYLTASVPLRLANAAATVVLPLLAVQQTGDIVAGGALGGALVAASLAPSVVAAPLVGALLDRTPHPRRWMMTAAVVQALSLLSAAGLGVVPLPIIVVLLVAGGVASPFYLGGMSSFVTDAIADERRAYADDGVSYNIASVGGPALAALVVALADARIASIVTAVVAALGAVGMLALHFAPRPRHDDLHLGRDILRAVRALTRHRPLAAVTASGTLSQLGQGALPIAAIALAHERAASADQGAWIVTAFAIGALAGGVAYALIPVRLRPEVVMGGGFAVVGLLTLGAVADLGMPFTLIVIGLSGIVVAPSAAAMLLLRKQQSRARVRSQVFTIGSGLRTAAAALGAAIVGQLGGAPAGLLIALIGVVWMASAAIMLAYPRGAQPVDATA
ncbi:MFS transporter [Schumannella sp. 10F1B-5-1]|uniref:MFS transporter n=1 Tax=Schumannella sp. 10F1B-5-1 TaxID=2590780 RepID=UPI0015E87378|nr:MFS transporter [Schumannella sp. 10F1B-5-1]